MGREDKIRFAESISPAINLGSWETLTVANQFRALEEDEIMFLDSMREKQEEEERQRKLRDGDEVMDFKKCVASSFIYISVFSSCFCYQEQLLHARTRRIIPPYQRCLLPLRPTSRQPLVSQ